MFCQQTKEFLREKGVAFQEHDVSSEAAAYAKLDELGIYTTPITLIDGEPVVGFDRPKLDRLLR
jgi:glutaredoxin